MPHEPKVELVDRVGEQRLSDVLDRMPDEAVADLIDHLPIHREKKILSRMDQEHAGDVRELRSYDPHTAGGRMTKNFVAVPEHFTAGQAIRAIQGSVNSETVSVLYVVDDNGRIKGVSGIGALLSHSPDTPLTQFMRRDMTFVGVNADQEEVARLARKYRLRAVPVVDNEMRLIGVVTLRDLFDVVHEEASEDMMKMAGSTLVDSLHTPTWVRYKLRLPWLFLTLGGELFIALVISRLFRATLARAAILAAFMPAIMATGGNVGLQSTTLIIRGLGMGTIRTSQVMKVLAAELRLGILLGITCGIGAATVAMLLESGHGEVVKLGAAIFLAMVSATGATSVVGTLEPLFLHRLNLDPATACGPFVTMFNDLFGTTIYFFIAMLLGFSSS
jgi:magnesium transporter